MNTSAQWRTKSYLLLPDVGSQMSFGSAMHTATMQQTQPRFGSNYFDASGPGPKYNTPHDRGIFQKPYLRKHTTFSRSDRFAYVDAFSASRGIPDRCSPGPGRYPASQSSFDKHVRSTERLKPVYKPPVKFWVTQEYPKPGRSKSALNSSSSAPNFGTVGI